MKHENASRAETTPRTPWLASAPSRYRRALGAASLPALALLLAACRGAPEPVAAARADDELASGDQSLLVECRRSADECLDAALDVNGAGACEEALVACAEDVSTDRGGVFPMAQRLRSRLLAKGARAVRGVVDVADALPGLALSGVRTCREEVVSCLDGAADLDVGECGDSLDACVDGVVAIIDPVIAPLPGPSGSAVVAAADTCRAEAGDCLAGALSLNDITSCRDVLGACVDGVEAILDQTLAEVNDVTDPLALPAPEDVVDCTLELAECLADLQNPFDCAEQARICSAP